MNETQRLMAFQRIDVPWPDWAMTKSRHLIQLAMRVFQTQYAAMSFFDHRNEIMKAECGYKRGAVPRNISIGAHALLSMEPMVVLDTFEV